MASHRRLGHQSRQPLGRIHRQRRGRRRARPGHRLRPSRPERQSRHRAQLQRRHRRRGWCAGDGRRQPRHRRRRHHRRRAQRHRRGRHRLWRDAALLLRPAVPRHAAGRGGECAQPCGGRCRRAQQQLGLRQRLLRRSEFRLPRQFLQPRLDRRPHGHVNAATNGRDGLGTIIVQSAGNAYGYGDDTNLHSFANNRWTITVGATNQDGTLSDYSTQGASILVGAPGSPSDGHHRHHRPGRRRRLCRRQLHHQLQRHLGRGADDLRRRRPDAGRQPESRLARRAGDPGLQRPQRRDHIRRPDQRRDQLERRRPDGQSRHRLRPGRRPCRGAPGRKLERHRAHQRQRDQRLRLSVARPRDPGWR